ncbi:MAG: hypothetical protein ACOCW4_00045 [bacterium]
MIKIIILVSDEDGRDGCFKRPVLLGGDTIAYLNHPLYRRPESRRPASRRPESRRE